MTNQPKFTHDCDRCKFLGHEGDHDHYLCDDGITPTLVARRSSEGPDYASCPVDLVRNHHEDHPLRTSHRLWAASLGIEEVSTPREGRRYD